MLKRQAEDFRRQLGGALAKMGFFMDCFALTPHHDYRNVIDLKVVCPCGGIEFVRFVMEVPPYDITTDRIMFDHVVRSVTDELAAHIRREVREGSLPEQWLERIPA